MKKTLAFNLLYGIQAIAKQNLDIIGVGKSSGILRFVDIDPVSDFHFTVESRANDGKYAIRYKPYDEDQNAEARSHQLAEQVIETFEEWTSFVRKYTELETVFDDPVLKKHEEYFSNEFRIVDEDASYAPFEIPKQFLLAEYIENIKIFIAENQEDFKDKNEPGILIQECHDLIEDLPTLPKNAVIKKIATVCAKIARNGMTILKKFISTSAPEFGKKIAQLSAENLIDLIKNHTDDIGSLLN